MASLVPITHLYGTQPTGTILSGQALAQYFQVTTLLEQAHEEAEKLTREAQEKLAQAESEAEAIRNAARREGLNEGKERIEEARAQAVSETIHWLIKEEELESCIAKQMEASIRELTAQTLMEYAGKQDKAELLASRIAQRVPELLEKGKLQIFVHSQNLSDIAHEFASDKRITVAVDDSLTLAQARLDSPLVQLRFDLEQHLALILQGLKKPIKYPECVAFEDDFKSDIAKIQLKKQVKKSRLNPYKMSQYTTLETNQTAPPQRVHYVQPHILAED